MTFENHINELRVKLIGLSFACPFDMENPVECQLHHLRLLTYEKRIEFINKLTPVEMNEIIENHNICLHKKEQ